MNTTIKQYLARSLFPRDTETSTFLERALSVVILFAVVLMVLDTEPDFRTQFGAWVKPIEFVIFFDFCAFCFVAGCKNIAALKVKFGIS
jgi:hypothetical protein